MSLDLCILIRNLALSPTKNTPQQTNPVLIRHHSRPAQKPHYNVIIYHYLLEHRSKAWIANENQDKDVKHGFMLVTFTDNDVVHASSLTLGVCFVHFILGHKDSGSYRTRV